MNVEEYFKEMYAKIWQGHDLSKFDDYYARNFEEIISVSGENKKPIAMKIKYDDLIKQAIWQKENYTNTLLEIIKIVEGLDNHISVYFYSSSMDKKTRELRHRCVCGIWHLNRDKKIDRAWAVVTPYYPT